MSKSLEEWAKDNGLSDLWDEFDTHAICGSPEDFARLAFTSLRQAVDEGKISVKEIK